MDVRPRQHRTRAVLIGLVLIAALGFVSPIPGGSTGTPTTCPTPTRAPHHLGQLVTRTPPPCPTPHTP